MKSLQIDPSKLLGLRLSMGSIAFGSKIGGKGGTKGGNPDTLGNAAQTK
jgi:hypothetical protein